MKKKGIGVLALLIILFIGICSFYFVYFKKDTNQEFNVSIRNNYVTVGDKLLIQIDGAKKKKCDISWYVDDNSIEGENEDFLEIKEDYLEKLVEVRVSKDGEEKTAMFYVSKLPVISFSTKGSITDAYSEIVMNMQGSKEYKDKDIYNGPARIKLRGNSTRGRDKKPYKLELNENTNLLGLGRSKDWVLLAEDIDHTLVRNRLVTYFAKEIGLENTSNSTSVVVFINNKYQGVYTLIEQIRIGEDQVDIYDYKKLANKLARELVIQDAIDSNLISTKEKNNSKDDKELIQKYNLTQDYEKCATDLYENLSWLSYPYDASIKRKTYDASNFVEIPDLNGGWLLEMDFYHNKNDLDSVRTAFKQNFYFNRPEYSYTNKELFEYAKKYIQTFEYALHSEDFTYHENDTHMKAESGQYNYIKGWITKEAQISYSDKEHEGYRYDDLFDMDSLINYFLVCEFSRNWDSMKNSVFVYKDIDRKACIGPVWDYDWAFGNINMYGINTNYPRGWQTTDYYFTNENLYQNYNWNRYLIKDRAFVEKLYEKYWEIRPTVIENIIKEDGILTNWKADLYEAGQANDARWRYTYKKYYSYGYDASWDALKAFIDKRVAWLDEQFSDVDTLYESLNSYDQYEWIQ